MNDTPLPPRRAPGIGGETPLPPQRPPGLGGAPSAATRAGQFSAELIVNGVIFREWESVMVRLAVRESQPTHKFRFTCSETLPIKKNIGLMQVKTGDYCTVKLAGQMAITGRVMSRQVYYDAWRHYVEIQGGTIAGETSQVSAITKSFETRDKTFEQNAKLLLGPMGIAFKVIGGQLPKIKFPRLSIMPSETVFEVLDRMSRYLGGLNFTSDETGAFVVAVGQTGGSDNLVEGINILEGRELIYNPDLVSNVTQAGLKPGTDKENGTKSAHEVFHDAGMDQMVKSYAPNVTLNEMPGWTQEHLKGRANSERNWQTEDAVTVTPTVLGWLRPSNKQLWSPMQKVSITSPMLMMDNMELTLRVATFMQDNVVGSRTTLECMNQKALGAWVTQSEST